MKLEKLKLKEFAEMSNEEMRRVVGGYETTTCSSKKTDNCSSATCDPERVWENGKMKSYKRECKLVSISMGYGHNRFEICDCQRV